MTVAPVLKIKFCFSSASLPAPEETFLSSREHTPLCSPGPHQKWQIKMAAAFCDSPTTTKTAKIWGHFFLSTQELSRLKIRGKEMRGNCPRDISKLLFGMRQRTRKWLWANSSGSWGLLTNQELLKQRLTWSQNTVVGTHIDQTRALHICVGIPVA